MDNQECEIFGIKFRKESTTGFLSVSNLARAYEKGRWMHGWSAADISSIMQSKKFVERTYHVLIQKNIISCDFEEFSKMCEESGITKVLKSLNVWRTTGARHTKSVMCDAYIWVALALELNPMIYAKVKIFITEGLLFDRIEAGDEFRPMNKAISTIVANPNYARYSMAINEKVFGKHFTGMRNLANAAELKQIVKIEQMVTSVIELGLVKTEEQVLNTIKNLK